MTSGRHLVELALLLVIAGGPVPLAVGLAAPAARGSRAPIARLLAAALTCWCVLEVTVAIGLGATRHLVLGWLLPAEIALAVVGCLLAGRRALDAVVRAAGRSPSSGGVTRLLLVAWSVVALAMVLRVSAVPITESDSLSYHLPAMAEWYQAHAFVMPGGLKPAAARYPYGWEALCTLFVMPFGEDFLVALPNVVAWVLFTVSIYVVALQVGARRADALGAALLAGTLPVTREVLTTMHVDLPLAAAFMAALSFAIGRDRVLLLPALALVVGIKLTGVVLGALLAAVAIAIARRAAASSARDARGPGLVAVAGAAALLVAGFWYAKNLVEVGNPLGAVRIAIGTFTIFPGAVEPAVLRRSTLLHQFHPGAPEDWGILLGMMQKRGGIGLVLLAAGAAASLLATRPRGRRVTWTLAALLLVTVAIYAATPFSGAWRFSPWIGVNFRYALPSIAVLAVLAALGATRLRLRHELVVGAVLIGAARVVDRTLLVALGLVLLALAISTAVRRSPQERRAPAAVGVAVLALVVAVGSFWLRRVHAAERALRYGAIAPFMETRVGPEETIGYVLSHWKYVFYGPDLRRRVVHVPAAGERERWLEDLGRLGVDLVAIGPIEPVVWATRPERVWLDDPQGPFARVFGRDPSREPVLYRIHPARGDR